jgi:hypothetical protein
VGFRIGNNNRRLENDGEKKKMTGATAFLDCRRDELRTPLSGAPSDPCIRCGKTHGLDPLCEHVRRLEKVERGAESEKYATSI